MLGNRFNAQEIWEGLVICGYVEGRTVDVTDEYKDGLPTKGLFAPMPGMIFNAKTSVRRDAFRDIMKKAKSQGSVLDYSNFRRHLQISRIYAMVSAKSSLDSKTASKIPKRKTSPAKGHRQSTQDDRNSKLAKHASPQALSGQKRKNTSTTSPETKMKSRS